MSITRTQLKQWLLNAAPVSDLRSEIRTAKALPTLQNIMRNAIPKVTDYPNLTYTLYRQFEHTGERDGYQPPYFARRAMLTRAVTEYIAGDAAMIDPIHDLLWAICEETSWVLPAHEEQGPDYWDINPPIMRTQPLGAHTMLTREPDSIDLFAAETGAALAEVVYLIGDDLAPEVRQRVIYEVQRHIFKPYLAYGRKHWWFKGALNWNGVCNGSIGLAFLRLEKDLETLSEALEMVLEGFEAYIATGFEPDGGSIEGVGYWNYGLLYFVTVAELLCELTSGKLDLLADERLKAIAYYPVGMALTPPLYLNFGDSTEATGIAPGIAQKLAERTGVTELLGLISGLDPYSAPIAKLPIIMRNIVWWDAEAVVSPPPPPRDYYLPDCRVVKFVGQTAKATPVVMGVTAGHNDGHHSHTDIASFIYHIGGESLIPDSARGKYAKAYFRQQRYDNIFNNSYTHNVPRINGQLQMPGAEFGGTQPYYGSIVDHGEESGHKFVVIDFHTAYEIPQLQKARRTLRLNASTGELMLEDEFEFEGDSLDVEEAFVTWDEVSVKGSVKGSVNANVNGNTVCIQGKHHSIELVAENAGQFQVESLEEACRKNGREGILKRISIPVNGKRFKLRITPVE